MDKFSLARAIALGLVAGSTLAGCDAPPVPTVLPPVPGPTAQSNLDVLTGTVCVGVDRGDGAGKVSGKLHQASGRDPNTQPFPSTQPVTIHTNQDGNGYYFDKTYRTIGDLASANLQAPADDGSYTTAACVGSNAAKEPEDVFIDLANKSGLRHVSPVCVTIKSGEIPTEVMQRAREKAGYAEEYDAFTTEDNLGRPREPVLIGNLHKLQGPIYAGRHACVTNWMDHLRTTHGKPTSSNPAPSKGYIGAGTRTRRG